MNNLKTQKKLATVLAVLMVLILVISALSFMTGFAGVSAVSAKPDFDKTDVLDDLRTSTVDGKPFDLTKYPPNEGGTAEVINFVEYCYSYKESLQGYYGLYVYVYNPKTLDIDTDSQQNKIQLATGYSEDGSPNDYEKFDLQLCSVSTESDFKNLFYKFKIVDRESAYGERIVERVNASGRRYDVSGIELHTRGEDNAVEYKHGKSYRFTGYAAGYGPDARADSTLVCEALELETVELTIHHTFYRTGLSNRGGGHQNQLDTVYFAVDNRLLEKYGKLQQIKAEWYEYKTREIVVTKNADFYDALNSNLGRTVSGDYNTGIGYGLYYDLVFTSFMAGTAAWAWNGIKYNPGLNTGINFKTCETLNYAFYRPKIEAYDPFGEKTVRGGIESNELYDYIKNNSTTGPYIEDVKNGTTLSSKFFAGAVDDGRTMGYNVRNFDADIDLHQLLSYNDGDPSFWDKWRDFGFWDTVFGKLPDLDQGYYDVPPIYAVKDGDILGSNAEVSKNLLIRNEDVGDFKAYVSNAKNRGQTVFLFRFATTDYMSKSAVIIKSSDNMLSIPDQEKDAAYVAQGTCFFDFDIIQLTFNKEGLYHTIPVVASPIDIVPGITPPIGFGESGLPWWAWVLIAIGIAVAVVLLIVFFPQIVKGLWKLVVWIAKGIGLAFKAVFYTFPKWIIQKIKGEG